MCALVEDFSDLFQKEVLERLDPVDRALLGRTGSAVRSAVKRSGLLRVGGSAEEPPVGIAAFCQSLSMFVWAVENGCTWQCTDTCDILAGGGQLEVLRWAREHHCPWEGATDDIDTDCCALAALGGHLEVLKWLREHDCPWDQFTCEYAAVGGHLEILQWAREHHCPWDEVTCESAADSGKLELLRWAIESGCPGGENYVHLLT